MNFTVTKEERIAIFHLSDTRIDTTNSAEVKAELLIISQEDIDILILDLTEVTFCDSSGLSALLLAERQMRERGGGIMVIDVNGKIRQLMEIAKLSDMVPVFTSIDDARAAIEG